MEAHTGKNMRRNQEHSDGQSLKQTTVYRVERLACSKIMSIRGDSPLCILPTSRVLGGIIFYGVLSNLSDFTEDGRPITTNFLLTV